MPKFAANLSFLFTDHAFRERFRLAAAAGFEGVEYLFPYDWPARATVRLLEHEPNREDTIHRSKAVGEPPLMLAMILTTVPALIVAPPSEVVAVVPDECVTVAVLPVVARIR